MTRYRIGVMVWMVLRLTTPTDVLAQGGASTRGRADSSRHQGLEHEAHMAMSGPMVPSAHMRMTASRSRTPADSVQAMAIADTLRRALGRYTDPAVAVREGYKLFAPDVKDQKVYHYTKWGNAIAEAFRFNPAQPTSLLYKKDANGHFMLTGAMYTMPKRSTEDALNARVPLSVAQWHQHIKLCAPPKGQDARLSETRNGVPLFGIDGSIVTEAECKAVGGRWWDSLFGWMVHANVFEGTDLKTVWGHSDDHAGH